MWQFLAALFAMNRYIVCYRKNWKKSSLFLNGGISKFSSVTEFVTKPIATKLVSA